MKSVITTGNIKSNLVAATSSFSPTIRQKVFRAAVAELLDAPALQTASPLVAGCAWAVLRLACDKAELETLGSHVKHDLAIGELVGRGVERSTALDVVDFLVRRSVFIAEGADLSIPALDVELAAQVRIFTNRSQGWQKRADSKGVSSKQPKPQKAPIANGDRSLLVDKILEPVQSGSTDLLGSPSPSTEKGSTTLVRKEIKRQLTGLMAENDVDALTCRMLTKDGAEFEVFKSYVDSVKQTFRHIDVSHQLSLASAWCLSNESQRKTAKGMPKFINGWLARANQAAEIRASVMRSTKEANGFGQGGSVDRQESSPKGSEAGGGFDIGTPRATDAGLDDFTDMNLTFDAPGGGDLILGAGEASFDAPGDPLEGDSAASDPIADHPPVSQFSVAPAGTRRVSQVIANARARATFIGAPQNSFVNR